MTLHEAKQRRDVFMDRYGNALRERINNSRPVPPYLVVSREIFEAVEDAFQHWPSVTLDGREFVGTCLFRSPNLAEDNVMFKGIPLVQQEPR
jgi:hypothetical protein